MNILNNINCLKLNLYFFTENKIQEMCISVPVKKRLHSVPPTFTSSITTNNNNNNNNNNNINKNKNNMDNIDNNNCNSINHECDKVKTLQLANASLQKVFIFLHTNSIHIIHTYFIFIHTNSIYL